MINIKEIELKKAIQWGLGSQGIWTPELEDILLKEIKGQALRQHGVSKSLPIGDVEVLLIALEHIAKWGDEEEERWDDPGDCAMDAITQYRYSISKGNVCYTLCYKPFLIKYL